VDREQFRGWLVSDSVTSSAVDNTLDTRIGYYLDPQPSGFSYISRQHNWALFDLALTRSRPCEQLASINVQNPDNEPACAGNLDFYTDGESLNGAQIVAWYSLARHLTPLLLTVLFGTGLQSPSVNAQSQLQCPVEFQITESFSNGASWEMCWEARKRENIVLSQITYTPPNAEPFPVMAALRLAQLHVAYDDSDE